MSQAESKKKMLIYAHYYYPDVASTGQILKELAEGMKDVFDIYVICTVPSYTGVIDEKYKTKRFYKEDINGVNVIRIRVPEFSKEKKLSRVRNIVSYYFGAKAATKKLGRIDYVYSISQPPILGGLLGVYGKKKKKAKFIYNIQDFNPEQTMAVDYCKNKLITKAMMFFDKRSCRISDKVIVVGRDMVETLKKRFKGERVPDYAYINNWINESEIYPLPEENRKVQDFKREYGLEGKYVIMYSGNIGLYYDLENLMRVIKKFRKGYTMTGIEEEGFFTPDGREVAFAFVGDGSMLKEIKAYKKRHHIDNVIFIPYQDKSDLIYSLNAGDVHWVVNAKGIKGISVPSKCYGVMAAGRPIIGVLEEGSEARLIIEETKCGLCCEPEDYESVAKIIEWFIENAYSDEALAMGKRGRDYLVGNLTKDISIEKYINEIIDL